MSMPTLICSIFALISCIVLLFIKKQLVKPFYKSIWRAAFIFFSAYLLIQLIVLFRWEFVLPPQRIADTGRNFAFITGAILAALITIPIISIDLILTYRKIQKSKNP